MTLGEKVEKHLGHWRDIIINDATTFFDEEDLKGKIDDVMVRMMEIVFEQQGDVGDWTDLVEEACRDCEVSEL
jgi:D-mannonate dehydratase